MGRDPRDAGFYHPSVVENILGVGRLAPQLSRLTPREAQVLAMAAQGLTNAQVAARLEVTIHAVKFHLSSIYRKLGVANRTEAAVAYLEHSRERSLSPLGDAAQALGAR
jgi:DNA-binding CsgD family transcriptional regulator